MALETSIGSNVEEDCWLGEATRLPSVTFMPDDLLGMRAPTFSYTRLWKLPSQSAAGALSIFADDPDFERLEFAYGDGSGRVLAVRRRGHLSPALRGREKSMLDR